MYSIFSFGKIYELKWSEVHNCYIKLYMMWMLRALWLVVAHDLSEDTYIGDITGNLFFLFCSKRRAVLKLFVSLFRFKASESLEKYLSRSYIQRKSMEKRRHKALLTTWERLNYKKFSQLPSCVIASRSSLCCKMFSPSSTFCFEHEKTLFKKRF